VDCGESKSDGFGSFTHLIVTHRWLEFSRLHIDEKSTKKRPNSCAEIESKDDPIPPLRMSGSRFNRFDHRRPLMQFPRAGIAVPDVADVIPEAFEIVEKGFVTEQDFREFTFTNAAMLHTRNNPGFSRVPLSASGCQ
jgi:hypothetical protein